MSELNFSEMSAPERRQMLESRILQMAARRLSALYAFTYEEFYRVGSLLRERGWTTQELPAHLENLAIFAESLPGAFLNCNLTADEARERAGMRRLAKRHQRFFLERGRVMVDFTYPSGEGAPRISAYRIGADGLEPCKVPTID